MKAAAVPTGVARDVTEAYLVRGHSSYLSANDGTSVVIICLNEEKRLDRCLRACAVDLDPLRDEIVVVDGESTDRTREVVRDASLGVPVRLVVAPRGYARQRNAGVVACSGEVIVFVSADATPAHGSIARLARPVRRGDCDIAQGRVIQGADRACDRWLADAVRALYARTIPGNVEDFSTVFAAVRRQLLLLRPFDPSLATVEDKLWLARLDLPHRFLMTRAHARHALHEGVLGYARRMKREACAVGTERVRCSVPCVPDLFGWHRSSMFLLFGEGGGILMAAACYALFGWSAMGAGLAIAMLPVLYSARRYFSSSTGRGAHPTTMGFFVYCLLAHSVAVGVLTGAWRNRTFGAWRSCAFLFRQNGARHLKLRGEQCELATLSDSSSERREVR